MVWNQRNNVVFNKPALTVVDVEHFVIDLLQKYRDVQNQGFQQNPVSPSLAEVMFVSKSLAQLNYLLLGCASTPIYAEAKALQATLSWCVVVHFPIEATELDCQVLVNKIKHKWKDRSSFSDLVQLVKNSLSLFPNVSLNHISRNDNVSAHNLARN
ncbi:hypothetical protein G4B88_026192 [Cannabis sativa]|uniref:RNase H type-1 domain-containing protein n=1 Tax=Cannabis sativa TaxID=3483 RepID=A0A7J6EY98_CANSA|nr:hypothetical protein G4B88_026192 [Cannabis sativa]